jgi:hypothetical protein
MGRKQFIKYCYKRDVFEIPDSVKNSIKYGAEERWGKSVGPIMRQMRKYYIESRRRGNPAQNEKKEG